MGLIRKITTGILAGIGHGAGNELFVRGKQKVKQKLEERKVKKTLEVEGSKTE